MSPRRGVVVLVDPEDEGEIVRAIDAVSESLHVVRRCADLAEARAAIRARVADLAVLDASDPDLDALVVEDLHRCGAGVVLVVDAADARGARALGADGLALRGSPDQVVESLLSFIRAGRAMDSDAADLEARLAEPENEAETPGCAPEARADTGERPDGRIIVVWGTSGAPGRSTIALGLAHALASAGATLLVDGDLKDPSLAHMTGTAVEASGLSALARRSLRGGVDLDALERAVIPHTPGLHLLTGLTSPHRWREVGPGALASILAVARTGYAHTVVDVAAVGLDPVAEEILHQGDRDDTTAAALRAATDLICVARADVVGVSRLAHAVEWYAENIGGPEPSVVVNRLDKASTGARPRNALDAALSTIVPGALVHLVPEDAGVARGLLAGRHVVASDPSSPAAQAIGALAESLTGIASPKRRSGRRRRVEH